MNNRKRPYQAPKLVRAGSFEELTRSASQWDDLIIFGLTGGAANAGAVS